MGWIGVDWVEGQKFRTDVTKLRKLLWRVLRLRYQELPSVILLSSLNYPSILRHLASRCLSLFEEGERKDKLDVGLGVFVTVR